MCARRFEHARPTGASSPSTVAPSGMQRLLSAPRSGQRSKSSALRWLARRRSGSKNHAKQSERREPPRLRRRDDALVGVAALEDRVAVHVRLWSNQVSRGVDGVKTAKRRD